MFCRRGYLPELERMLFRESLMKLTMLNDRIVPMDELDPIYFDRGIYFGDGVY